jgi:hypothetical protein
MGRSPHTLGGDMFTVNSHPRVNGKRPGGQGTFVLGDCAISHVTFPRRRTLPDGTVEEATGEQRWFCTEKPTATGGASSITLRRSPLARTDLLLGAPADHYV